MRKCSGVILIVSLAAVLFLLSPSPSTTPRPAAGPVAHLLPSLPGLSALYPPPANSTAHLSWRLLRTVLSRSDAIPGTATGVLEAAAAWRNLTLAVAAAAGPSSDAGRGGSPNAICPASVEGDLRTRGARIPCGFAEGSAVTVVGVPKQGAAGLRVEMVGGGGEVVACFNVSLGAAGMVVEQSSWTLEEGWGKWERCPPLGDIGSNSSWQLSPVDGLVCCNQQVGASVIPASNNVVENVTGSQPEDEKLPRRRAHLSSSVPIVEGESFTATLWAGAEGFHMTVNGRHETSFAYREVFDRG